MTNKEKQKSQYHKLKAEEKCPRCKVGVPKNGHTYCFECRSKMGKNTNGKQRKNITNGKQKKYLPLTDEKRQAYYANYRDRYHKLKAEGKCPRCKKIILDKKYTLCVECRNKGNVVVKQEYHKLKEEGKCPICKEIIMDNRYTTCLNCRISKRAVDKETRDAANNRARGISLKKLRGAFSKEFEDNFVFMGFRPVNTLFKKYNLPL